jgi:hypothetical protein
VHRGHLVSWSAKGRLGGYPPGCPAPALRGWR